MIYSYDPKKRLPIIWTNDLCYDFLDHMLYLAEQEQTPFYIPLCCGLDHYIGHQPYNYDGVRHWIRLHRQLTEKIWRTVIRSV